MKTKQWLLQLQRSIFFKLLLIFLATAILLASLLGLSVNYLSDPERFIHQKIQANIVQYADYLMQEIGTPPDINKANFLAEKLGMEIQIKRDDKVWQSPNFSLPSGTAFRAHEIKNSNMKMGHYRGYSFVNIKGDAADYTFAINHKRFSEYKGLFLLTIFLIIVIVISFSYFLVRWQFKPIKWISEGVSHVADGDFEFKIPVRKHDELGELSAAFNRMSDEIQGMIKSKEQLLLDVSHELRSPITRMKLELELMESDAGKVSLQDDIRQMETMITELLESARLNNSRTPLSKSTFNLISLIDEMILAQGENKPGIKSMIKDKQVLVTADKDRLRIVLRNLFDNALKYSKDQMRPVEVDIIITELTVNLLIRDFGEGIPQADMSFIFEPFYRVDKSRNTKTGGYGLGLSLSKKIMTAHGGDLQVDYSPEAGTVFTMLLPNYKER